MARKAKPKLYEKELYVDYTRPIRIILRVAWNAQSLKLLNLVKTFSVPENIAHCKYCEETILWAETFTWKKVPLDFVENSGNDFTISFHECPNRIQSDHDFL